MRRHALALATAIALSCTGVAHAADPVAGSFASSIAQKISFDIDFFGTLTGAVSAAATPLSGFKISSVTVNGVLLSDLIPGDSYFAEFTFDVAPGTMTIDIKGTSIKGGMYTGAFAVTPVPEPATAGMALAGLALVGGVAAVRRRRG
jgi:MYXO-CTERM domain-containing protein